MVYFFAKTAGGNVKVYKMKVLEWVEGQPAHEKFEYLDAGIFCSDECLIDYLVNKSI
jgi:hypothetical protein